MPTCVEQEGGPGSGDVQAKIDSVERWRELAAEARAVADKLTDPDAKQVMVRIAEGYELLIRRAEARKNDRD